MTYKEKHELLLSEIKQTIQTLTYHMGYASSHNGEKCLLPEYDFCYNVGSSWISEVHADKLLTADGHAYDFSTLSTHQMVELADHLMKKYG